MKNKEKKKGKQKKAEKKLKKGKIKIAASEKPGKLKTSEKALHKEIHRLMLELKSRDEELSELRAGQQAAPVAAVETDLLTQSLHESSDAGTISERKKIWERHQYLRSSYEKHLEAGLAKPAARISADRDLRERYGDEFGYTEEELDSILS